MRSAIVIAALALGLSACTGGPDLAPLAKDPAVVSIHTTFQGPGWSTTTDIVRSGTPGETATATGNGATVGKNAPAAPQ